MKDIRDFLAECEKAGEVHRIVAEVDWNLELSHTARLVNERKGLATFFENVKGYEIPVFAGTLTSEARLAIAMGLAKDCSMVDLSREWMRVTTTTDPIKPSFVKDGPILQNVIEGDKVNLFDFPVPHFNVRDGGRYIGTWCYLITRDPETGWVNLGCIRMQLHDNTHIGLNLEGGKHGNRMLKQYRAMGKKMPAQIVIGSDPILFLVSGTSIPVQTDEYDVAGQLRGQPVEVIESDLNGLPFPAHAEIVIEGDIDPDNYHPEGPFAEYTGYYSGTIGKSENRPNLEVQRVFHRNDPIFCVSAAGKPVDDVHMIVALNHNASLWTELAEMKIPGIKAVYTPPSAAARFWCIVSIEQEYPAHARQVGAAVFGTTTGSYGLKGCIVVDEDVRVDDWDEVMWALGVRYNPKDRTQILDIGRSTPLDPSLPIEARRIGSKIIMDATLPYEWKQKPVLVKPDEDTIKRIESRWKEFGLDD